MKFQLILIWVNSLFFTLYGLGFIFLPNTLFSFITDSQLTSPSALIDIRATFGGMSLGLGIVLALFTLTPSNHRLGLWAILVIMLGMACSRSLGLLQENSANNMMFIYLVCEMIVALLALIALGYDRKMMQTKK
ncbi:DUF4345 domain-containing protein [uncultured Shewanella sp.]|uniref:DUF4345 domain-containing protein n=1 Tax=uncultured Shewanella sp. TaxID=173975 RepID=UPI0026327D85|nr:DUF4345 domain-containing protein [uncultured Shewanella sp.]